MQIIHIIVIFLVIVVSFYYFNNKKMIIQDNFEGFEIDDLNVVSHKDGDYNFSAVNNENQS
jgi:hypothetical protein